MMRNASLYVTSLSATVSPLHRNVSNGAETLVTAEELYIRGTEFWHCSQACFLVIDQGHHDMILGLAWG